MHHVLVVCLYIERENPWRDPGVFYAQRFFLKIAIDCNPWAQFCRISHAHRKQWRGPSKFAGPPLPPPLDTPLRKAGTGGISMCEEFSNMNTVQHLLTHPGGYHYTANNLPPNFAGQYHLEHIPRREYARTAKSILRRGPKLGGQYHMKPYSRESILHPFYATHSILPVLLHSPISALTENLCFSFFALAEDLCFSFFPFTENLCFSFFPFTAIFW